MGTYYINQATTTPFYSIKLLKPSGNFIYDQV
jgi:hypothetical protein